MKRSREQDEQSEPRDESEQAGPSDDGNEPRRAKVFDIDLLGGTTDSSLAMTCLLHTEKMTFSSYDEYETHYTNAHRNRCLECRANFPSAQILGIHIEDCHDPLAALKRESGEHTYSCFVEGCERKCATPDKRRLHLIDKHMFPRNFFFAVAREGIDGRRSLLDETRRRRGRSSTATKKDARRRSVVLEAGVSDPEAGDARDDELGADSGNAPLERNSVEGVVGGDTGRDEEVDHLVGALAALRFVPPSVRFGRGGRAGFSRR